MKKLLLFFVLIMAGANFVYASKIAPTLFLSHVSRCCRQTA